jgi:hypothetical protein
LVAATQREVQAMLAHAAALDSRQPQFARVGREPLRRIGDDRQLRLALRCRIQQQTGEAASWRGNGAKGTCAQRPLLACRGRDDPRVAPCDVVGRPRLPEETTAFDVGGQARACRDDHRRGGFIADLDAAPERQDFDALGGTPARRKRYGHDLRLAAVEVVVAIEPDPCGHAQGVRQRQQCVGLDQGRAVGVGFRHEAQHARVAGLAQPVVDDARRRRERIVLRAQSDAHAVARDEAAGEFPLPVDGEPLQADVAGVDGAEPAHVSGVVQADVFAADAVAECVLGGGHRIVVGPLRRGGRAGQDERAQDHGSRGQAHENVIGNGGEPPSWTGSSRPGRTPFVLQLCDIFTA